ncbi:MAG TPA: hypothetical protein VK642_04360 [Burkholderiales bacterium]|nr:hypothetical protein [Burkholderiales bacterium]
MPFRLFLFVMGVVVAILSVTGVVIWLKKRRARTFTVNKTDSTRGI